MSLCLCITLMNRYFAVDASYSDFCQDVIAEGGFAIVFLVKTSHGTRLALKR